MPAVLRSRLALAVLVGVFLIPIVSSSLRGLTHVLTCEENVATPFTVIAEEGFDPIVLSATQIVAGEEPELCGGLQVDLQARVVDGGRLGLDVVITNGTEQPWRGTVSLDLDSARVPVNIGRVEAGAEVTEMITINLSPGTREISGTLLLGP